MKLVDSLGKLLRNRNFILMLSIILGLLVPQAVPWTNRIFLPILIFIMTISMLNITGTIFDNPRKWIKPITYSLIINYLVLGTSIILFSYIFKLPQPYLTGFIILGAVPPAVAVIPFTSFLGGNQDFSLIGFIACYVGAFLITPLTLLAFLGLQQGFHMRIITLLVELILLPFLVSRPLLRFQVDDKIESHKGTLINWGFFLIIYTIVGLNREVFLSTPSSLIPLIIIGILITFVMGFAIEKIGERMGLDSETLMSLILLGTSKNSGFAAGLAISLFGAESTVPTSITTVFMLIYVIFLDIKKK